MAKGNPNSAAIQYKVHLKPTEVGALVIKRMERPHLDKSAELRRFIELGYAAEQAGFILDGTVLRHAGRTWDTQPDFAVSPEQSDDCTAGEGQPGAQRRVGSPSKPTSHHGKLVDAVPGNDGVEGVDVKTSSLRANLRGISG
jgi:hypothetical protein